MQPIRTVSDVQLEFVVRHGGIPISAHRRSACGDSGSACARSVPHLESTTRRCGKTLASSEKGEHVALGFDRARDEQLFAGGYLSCRFTMVVFHDDLEGMGESAPVVATAYRSRFTTPTARSVTIPRKVSRDSLRLHKVLQHLRDESLAISEVAVLFGFSDVSAFDKAWTGAPAWRLSRATLSQGVAVIRLSLIRERRLALEIEEQVTPLV